MKIAERLIKRQNDIRQLALIEKIRLNSAPVYLPVPTVLDCLEYLVKRKQVERIEIEGDFFSQPADNAIYKFVDGSCIVVGLQTADKPFKYADNFERAIELNESIYY